jgi:hypothetical protein
MKMVQLAASSCTENVLEIPYEFDAMSMPVEEKRRWYRAVSSRLKLNRPAAFSWKTEAIGQGTSQPPCRQRCGVQYAQKRTEPSVCGEHVGVW